MRLGMIRGLSNVVRFPVERRAAPTLELLRQIAPDSREVWLVAEAFGLEQALHELRPAADRRTAEWIRNQEPGERRRAVLADLLAPLLRQALDLCRQAHDAMEAARAAQEQLAAAQSEGGYWLPPLERRADGLTSEAARLLVDAYVASEESEGAARAIALAGRGEAWHPFDPRAEAEALFFGT